MDRVNRWCHGHLWAWEMESWDALSGMAPQRKCVVRSNPGSLDGLARGARDDERWPRSGNEQMVLKE